MTPMVLAVGAVLLAALVARQAVSREALRRLTVVAAVALILRLLAVTIIYSIAIRTHGEGTWLNDEASFYLAAESLLPNPFDAALPHGLDHLGGNGYLGLLTLIAIAGQQMDTVAFRLANATLGTMVALLTTIIAARVIGRGPALIAGLIVGAWPTLVFWSATFLRDTLCSFVVVVVWSTLAAHDRIGRPRVAAVVIMALVLLAGLRPYLAGGVAIGVLVWAAFPWLTGRRPRTLAFGAALGALVLAGAALTQTRQINEAAHQLVYRQTTTRMETLGRLYYDVDPNAPPQEPPYGPGAAIALIDPDSGWLETGLIQQPLGPGMVLVAFTDETLRAERIEDLILLQSAPLSPLQVTASLGPGLLSFVSGAPRGADASSIVWTADALAWDALFVLALLGGLRAKVPARDWLYPAVVILATVAALVAVPGAPGNDNRHRSGQAVPLLAVFAAGLLASRSRPELEDGRAVTTATSRPASAATLTASRTRSPR
jgi:hypothetical protein